MPVQKTAAEVVPFGKYKGQPVETLAADSDYCEWLTAQTWFRERYGNVYNTIINYGAEPQDSPEHNEMQARFLNDEWCFALADLLRPRRKHTYGVEAARKLLNADPNYQAFHECCELEIDEPAIEPRQFEDQGWDVVYGIEGASIFARRTKLVPPLPACTCECDHTDCYDDAKCRGGRAYCRHDGHEKGRGISYHYHCCDGCYWAHDGPLTREQRQWLEGAHHSYEPPYGGLIRAELKPDLGDDYPSVLRQVTGYRSEYRDIRCVVVRRYAFERVTWDQVRKIFAASQITLLAEAEITAAPTPEDQALALIQNQLGAEVIA